MNTKSPQDALIQSVPAQCASATVHDLSDRVFLHAVEQSDVAISITDPHANILYVNPAFTRVTGYTPADVVGRNESLLSNKTTPPEVYKALWLNISRGKPWSGRLVNKRCDGSRYLAELSITPVADDTGVIANYLGMHRDLTDMHKLECQVRNQKELIESVVDSAPMVLALLDSEDRLVLDNQAYKKLQADLGMAEPAPLFMAALRAMLGDALSWGAGDVRNGSAFLDRDVRIDLGASRPPRWFSCSGVWVDVCDDHADAFFDGGSHHYLLLVAKETTTLRTEEEKARRAALQALVAEEERINDLRESLSAAIFQLEGPLNMMSSAVGMLNRRSPEDPMAVALSEAIGSGEAALETLRTMIPAPSVEAATATNLNELLRSVLDLATPRLLAAGIRVAWQPQTVLPPIQGYPKQLLMLFKALMDNAIEAMSVRGWRERELMVSTRLLNGDVEVIVADSGPGIPAHLQLKVFEPFFTTKRDGGRHLGTGLAIAQQAVIDHGGAINIEPADAGCRLRVLLPVQR